MTLADVLLGVGVIFVSAIIAAQLVPIFVPRYKVAARLLVFLLLVWLVGSVWLGLSFLWLVVLYVVLVVVLVLLGRFR